MKSIALAVGFAALASAYTPPTTNDYGALTEPDLSHPVTQGQAYTVTWQQPAGAPAGQTVSLVLCNGPSSNCKTQSTAIVEHVPAAQQSYTWNVPCDLPTGVQNTATGYGMLIIVDGTGSFQYSTQFSVVAGSCSGGSTTTTTTSSSNGSTTTTTTSSSSSGSTTSAGWNSWNGTTSVAPTSSSWSSWTTSQAVAPSTTVPAYTSAYSPTTASASPSSFTGAAVHVAVNVAGAVGAAALAAFAL